jgi:hypothetical protein
MGWHLFSVLCQKLYNSIILKQVLKKLATRTVAGPSDLGEEKWQASVYVVTNRCAA